MWPVKNVTSSSRPRSAAASHTRAEITQAPRRDHVGRRHPVVPQQEQPHTVHPERGDHVELVGDLAGVEVRPPRHRLVARPVVASQPEPLRDASGPSRRPSRRRTVVIDVSSRWIRAEWTRWAASISSRRSDTSSPPRTTGTPPTIVSRARRRTAAQPRLDRIGDGSGELRSGEVPDREVADGAGSEHAELALAPEASGAAERGELERHPRRSGRGTVAQLGEQHRLAGLEPQRRRVGRRRAIDTETDLHPGGAQVDHRCDAGREDQVARRAVRGTDAGGAEPRDLRRVRASRNGRPTCGRCTSRSVRGTPSAGSRTSPG